MIKDLIKKNKKYYNFYLTYIYDYYREITDTIVWIKNLLKSPFPNWCKHKVIRKYSIYNSIFIETGTFTGYTLIKTKNLFKKIYSFEPSDKFYNISKNRLKKYKKIMLYNEISEIGLPKLLNKISGNITFWLDGHYSGNETYRGPNKVPIKYELNAIIKNKKRINKFVILIDDYRLFGKYPYPSKNYLKIFCKKNNLKYQLTKDIFIINN
jgi:hypothetical protein